VLETNYLECTQITFKFKIIHKNRESKKTDNDLENFCVLDNLKGFSE